MSLTLNQLSYFVEVVRQRNFTKAAENIFVSQSTLSKSIRNMEEELHVKLIDRTTKGFTLTPEGKLFAEYAERILRFYESQLRDFKLCLNTVDKTLNVGLPPSAGTAYFYAVIREFMNKCSDVKLNPIEVPSKGIVEALNNDDLDIGIVLEPFSDDSLIVRRAYSSNVMVCVNIKHPLAQKDTITFEELNEEPIIMISKDFMFHDLVMERFSNAGVTPNVIFETSQWDLEYEMVAENYGVCFLPEILLAKQRDGRVKGLRIVNPEFPWILSLVYRKDKFISGPMKMFIDISTGVSTR